MADPLIVPDVAVSMAVPGEMAVASPPLATVATEVADDVHVTVALTFCFVPLLKVPVAVNCPTVPATTVTVAGVTVIDVTTAGVTVRTADPLMVP